MNASLALVPTLQQSTHNPTREFSRAAEEWLDTHSRYISEETSTDYRKVLKLLLPFFKGMTLGNIGINEVRAYQKTREAKKRVNKECIVLRLILNECGLLWNKNIDPWYKPVRFKKTEKGRRLTEAEEARLNAVVTQAVRENRKQWALAGNCLLVMANTAFGFKELKYLRRRDVDLEQKLIRLEVSAKNAARYRTVPLNHIAHKAISYLVRRWHSIGGSDPDQFILPHRAHVAGAKWNFYKPMGEIKNAHKKIMAAADIKDFRIYDCRHHAQSKWLSNPHIAPEVVDAMAGHVSAAMRKKYSHQLIDTMRAAVDSTNVESASRPNTPTLATLEGRFSSTALMGRFL